MSCCFLSLLPFLKQKLFLKVSSEIFNKSPWVRPQCPRKGRTLLTHALQWEITYSYAATILTYSENFNPPCEVFPCISTCPPYFLSEHRTLVKCPHTSFSPDDKTKLSPGPLGARSPLSILHFPGCVIVQIVNTWYHLYFFSFLNPDSLNLSNNCQFNQLHISLCPCTVGHSSTPGILQLMQSFRLSLLYFISLF